MRRGEVMLGEVGQGNKAGWVRQKFFLYEKNIIHYQIISKLDFVDSELIVSYITTTNTIMTRSSVYERCI